MNRSLAMCVLELFFGWAILSASIVPFNLNTLTLAMTIIGGGMIIDGLRRLLRREPIPTGIP